MSDPRNNLWKREVSGLEPWEAASSFDADDDRQRPNVEPREASSSFDAADDQRRPDAPPVRQYSISASSLSQDALASKVRRLKDNVQLARQDCLELRREANELREHSDAELDRVTRYLGVLADETWKQGEDAAPVACLDVCVFLLPLSGF
ncbi:kinesin-like protein KIN-14A [Syzygium oleosum]|uniref:kinesin-like protein KIN-14A n=1 Tax=Syzygium oleosum TaxID=219896 RepID=UPI0024BA1F2C|nr:kinesin-like protein KIN-14A [Syzygium oleosum]